MKATGVSRNVDELGRVVIPKELRRTLGIDVKDPLAIFVHEDQIVLRKYNAGCLFCGHVNDDMRYFHGEQVCLSCLGELAEHLARGQVAASK